MTRRFRLLNYLNETPINDDIYSSFEECDFAGEKLFKEEGILTLIEEL